MRGKVIPTILILAALAIASFLLYKNQSSDNVSFGVETLETQSGEVVVQMGENAYNPINLKITKGTKVTFVNQSDDYRWPASDLHPSHLIFPDFDSKEALPPGEQWSFVFEKEGEWGYHDHLAPYITGTIIIVEN